ncbi:hypothetical protein Tco_0925814 [Tanacetum coccineum]|uniref:Uncharacterized protein n=1 Tax=Tanacetum coccineum TaxID=301880 RepID=A0ABQ5D951_9ASTR
MADHSQKWHNGSPSQSVCCSKNSKGMAVITSKLDNLSRDMKKLKESVHAIKVGYHLCGGPHLDKECPLNEECLDLATNHPDDLEEMRFEMAKWLVDYGGLKSDQAEKGSNYALMAYSSSSSDSEIESVEEKLEVYKANESIYSQDIKFLKFEIECKDIAIRELRKKLKIAQKEKDSIQFNKGLRYNVVPPPYTGNFMPPTPDLSFTGLDEFVNKLVVKNRKSDEEVSKVDCNYQQKQFQNQRMVKPIWNNACTKASDNAGQARKETEPVKNYILLPLWTADPPFSHDPKSSHNDRFKPSSDDGKKLMLLVEKQALNFHLSRYACLEDISIFDLSRDDEDVGAEADMYNLDTTIQVNPIPTTRIHKDRPLNQVIGDLQSAIQTRRISKSLEEHGFVSTIQQRTNHKDLQNCLFGWVLVRDKPVGKRVVGSG